MYGDINLVGHLIISHKARRFGILSVIFSFETNLNFSRRQIRPSIFSLDVELDNSSISKWRYKKAHLIFNFKSFILRKELKLFMKIKID